MNDNPDMYCPLCGTRHNTLFHRDKRRDYLRCSQCALVFVPEAFHLSDEDEKSEYDLHRNDPGDTGYRRFLGRLFEPLQARLGARSQGLDFGSGPGPALSLMLTEAGHTMAVYDRFYADNPEVFTAQYDFITATEVVEHLRKPRAELERLWACLRPGGWLGIMTKLVIDADAFSRWHYKNDMTHIAFFSHDTFAWLARQWGTEAIHIGNDVILLQKPA